MKKYLVALDQGTTSSRAIVFDRSQQIVASAQKEFPQLYPQAGWVEHDPLLKPLKIVVGLGRSDDRSAHPHGMDGHGGGGHRKAPLGRHRQWDANGMAAP